MADLFNGNPEVNLKSKPFDSTIIMSLDSKLKINIAQINSVMEGNGIVQPDTESSGGEVSGEGSGEGSGLPDETTEGSGEKVLPTTTSTTSSTTTESDDTEGSGVGSGYGKNTETTEKTLPPIVRTMSTRAPTKPACHPNDHNCQPTEANNGDNGIGDGRSNNADSINVYWHSDNKQQRQQQKGKKVSSASTLSMNLFAVALSALLAFMLL